MGSASGVRSEQQVAANVLGLELNVKNGDNGIFVSQLLQGAVGEEAFRMYSTATVSSNQTGSRQKQDWRGTNCLSTGSPCCLDRSGLGDCRGTLGRKASSPVKRGSPKTVLGADASWWAVSWGGELWEDEPSNFIPQAIFSPGELVSWWNLKQPAP